MSCKIPLVGIFSEKYFKEAIHCTVAISKFNKNTYGTFFEKMFNNSEPFPEIST